MTKGEMYKVKIKLMSLIEEAHPDLTPKPGWRHVLGDWRLKNWELQETRLPIVTVRLGTGRVIDYVYGRQINDAFGTHVVYPFSAHIFALNVDDRLKARKTMEIADAIITRLEKFTGDIGEPSGIIHFYDLTARESEPEGGPARISRIIIEGFILCQRPLS